MELKSIHKGEKEFLEHFEKHPHFEEIRKEKPLSQEQAKQTIKDFLSQLSEEIKNLPEVRKEAEIHHQSLENISNVLAQAINIALTQGIIDGLKYIAQTKNPYLIDSYHDLLAGHFFNTLVKHNKIKLIT